MDLETYLSDKKNIEVRVKDRLLAHIDIFLKDNMVARAVNNINLLSDLYDTDEDKNKLSKTVNKWINKYINYQSYEEALFLYKEAKKLIPDLKIDTIHSKQYELIIQKTVIAIKKVWDFPRQLTEIIIEGIKEGAGELTFKTLDYADGIVRGEKEETEKESIKQATLVLPELYANIYEENDKLVVQCDMVTVSIRATDQNNKEQKIHKTDYGIEIQIG